MACELCDDTGWKAVTDRRRAPRRALRLLARQGATTRLLEDARIPPRYRACDLETFVTYPNEKLLGGGAARATFRR